MKTTTIALLILCANLLVIAQADSASNAYIITVSSGTTVRVSREVLINDVADCLKDLGVTSNSAILVEGYPWTYHKDIKTVLDQVVLSGATSATFKSVHPYLWDVRYSSDAEPKHVSPEHEETTNAEPAGGAYFLPAAGKQSGHP